MSAVILLDIAMVAAVVVIHYESLFQLSKLLPILNIRHRYHIVVGVIGALLAHVVEVSLFALAYFKLNDRPGWGLLRGEEFSGTFADCLYFSFTTFTTLGFGDIEPSGSLRFLTGVESLTGLMLITWSASFLYLQMQNYWHDHKHQ